MIDFFDSSVTTPCYIVDEQQLTRNLEILQRAAQEANCKILLAQKAFSMPSTYPLISKYLAGTTASGINEARLGYENFGKENHVFSAAYSINELNELLKICDHIVFNSFSQWEQFSSVAKKSGKACGIRLNPEFSTQDKAIYDPCSPFSRMGVTASNFREDLLEGISGFHFHTLCEQNADALISTLKAVEEKFGKYFSQISWINFGGGHHITKKGYDLDALIACVKDFKSRYNLEVYLEPGEAVALDAGFLVASVLDIVKNGKNIAILDASAACHMPDVLEMPYRPQIIGGGMPKEKEYDYRLGSASCLSGDIIGDYSFDKPLKIGDRLVFCDMAIYSMVKNNTFNGINLPSIYLNKTNGTLQKIRTFGYNDLLSRL